MNHRQRVTNYLFLQTQLGQKSLRFLIALLYEGSMKPPVYCPDLNSFYFTT